MVGGNLWWVDAVRGGEVRLRLRGRGPRCGVGCELRAWLLIMRCPGFLCCRSCKTHAFDMADKPSIKYFISQRLHSPRMERVGRGCWKKEKKNTSKKWTKRKKLQLDIMTSTAAAAEKSATQLKHWHFFWRFSFRQLRHKFLGKKRAWWMGSGLRNIFHFPLTRQRIMSVWS